MGALLVNNHMEVLGKDMIHEKVFMALKVELVSQDMYLE